MLGKNALGSVLAVHKRRNYGDAHVTRLARNADQLGPGKGDFSRAWVDCIIGKSERERGGGGKIILQFNEFRATIRGMAACCIRMTSLCSSYGSVLP